MKAFIIQCLDRNNQPSLEQLLSSDFLSKQNLISGGADDKQWEQLFSTERIGSEIE